MLWDWHQPENIHRKGKDHCIGSLLFNGEENLLHYLHFFVYFIHLVPPYILSHLNQFFSPTIKTMFVYSTTAVPLAVNSRSAFTFLPHWIGFDQTRKYVLICTFYLCTETSESKPVKLKTSRTYSDVSPLQMVSFPCPNQCDRIGRFFGFWAAFQSLWQ